MKTRKEQFDAAVRNSLDQVSKDVEYAETRRWLIEDISEAERKVRHRDQGKEKCGDSAKILYGFASASESQLLYSTHRRVADQGAD